MTSSADHDLVKGLRKLKLSPEPSNGSAVSKSQDDIFRGVIRSNHRARDITKEFAEASNCLEIGQLIKDDNFSLFDGVQALELMDPKMDTGFLAPGETLEDDYDVYKSLLPEEVLGILDQVICYYTAWLDGFPLAQTLFSCLYIDHLLGQDRKEKSLPKFRPTLPTMKDPGDLVQLVLRAFCIGMIKCCDVAIEMVQSQTYFEEEDFNTHTFSRNMLSDIDDDNCLELIGEAVSWLQEQQEIDEEVREGLRMRLELAHSLYHIVLPVAVDQLEKSGETWSYVLPAIKQLQLSHKSARPVPEAFSAKVQRRLASTVPPRPIVEVDFMEACNMILAMFGDIEQAAKIASSESNIFTLTLLLNDFSRRGKGPNTLARAVLQSMLLSDGRLAGPDGGMQRILFSLIQYWAPDNSAWLSEKCWLVQRPSHPRFRSSRLLDWYVQQASPEFTNYLRSLCQNPCRVRRCLINIAKDFDVFHDELAKKMFSGDIPKCLTETNGDDMGDLKWLVWCTSKRFQCQILESINCLGFELDIYAKDLDPKEHSYLYYFLQSQCDQRRLGIAEHEEEMMVILQAAIENKTVIDADDMVAYTAYLYRLRHELAVCAYWEALARALSQIYMIHERLAIVAGLVRLPRYWHPLMYLDLREKPFSNIKYGTLHPDWVEFVGICNAGTLKDNPGNELMHRIKVAQEVLTEASKAIKGLTKEPAPASELDWVQKLWQKDLKAQLRICVVGSVQLTQLQQGLKKYNNDPIELMKHLTIEEGKHRYRAWVLPGIVIE